jgi:UTP-glucose-1-phosphate uridylyltransferase
LRELLKTEDMYAVVDEDAGYDTGNILAWLETNCALTLESEEYGAKLRDILENLLADES